MNAGGVVLCGGRSSRMGRPKAWLPFAGQPLLTRVVERLRGVLDPVVVVAAPGQDLPPLPGDVAVARDPREYRGPLQGLATGLAALAGRVDAVYLSSCDAPFLRPAFVRRLLALLGPHAVCVPHVGDHYHPLAAAYRVDVLPAVEQLLAADRLRPVFLFEVVSTRIVAPAELADVDPAFESLRNLNTLEDYEQALREV